MVHPDLVRTNTDDLTHMIFRNHIGRLGQYGGSQSRCMRDVSRFRKYSECCEYRTQMLSKGFARLEQFAYAHDVPARTLTEARALYARVTSLPQFSRKHRACVLGAVALQTCDRVDPREVCAFFGVQSVRTMSRMREDIQQECALQSYSEHTQMYIHKIGRRVSCVDTPGVPRCAANVIRPALSILQASSIDRDGFRPVSIAAACIAAACMSPDASVPNCVKRHVAKCAGVSVATLNSCLRSLCRVESSR
jgi:transcription initiation factor TFIIIB Brf1 subunit/transcription initiation factor TFIIB